MFKVETPPGMPKPPDGFLTALGTLDPLLYVAWNPTARQGRGRWTLRRKRSRDRPDYESKNDQWVMYLEYGPEDVYPENPWARYNDWLDRLREADVWMRFGRGRRAAEEFARQVAAQEEAEARKRDIFVSPLSGKEFAPVPAKEKRARAHARVHRAKRCGCWVVGAPKWNGCGKVTD